VVSGTTASRAGARRQTQKEHGTYGELYKYTRMVFYQDADTTIKIRVKTSFFCFFCTGGRTPKGPEAVLSGGVTYYKEVEMLEGCTLNGFYK
jgi:hypothetical protein